MSNEPTTFAGRMQKELRARAKRIAEIEAQRDACRQALDALEAERDEARQFAELWLARATDHLSYSTHLVPPWDGGGTPDEHTHTERRERLDRVVKAWGDAEGEP